MRRLANLSVKFLRGQAWRGTCPICEQRTVFVAKGPWYRDQLVCGTCASLPRERALMRVIASLYPGWRDLAIHESSPSTRGASRKLAEGSVRYESSQYLPDLAPGTRDTRGHRAEDLERQSFDDAVFDLVVTQDVFEHLFHPDQAIAEIMRTLRPGGAHIMTVPVVRKDRASVRRASLVDGTVVHHAAPEYHGNPVGDGSSLVTIDWGYDIADYLTYHAGCPTTIVQIEDRAQGIVAEYLDVVVTRKPRDRPPFGL